MYIRAVASLTKMSGMRDGAIRRSKAARAETNSSCEPYASWTGGFSPVFRIAYSRSDAAMSSRSFEVWTDIPPTTITLGVRLSISSRNAARSPWSFRLSNFVCVRMLPSSSSITAMTASRKSPFPFVRARTEGVSPCSMRTVAKGRTLTR